MPRPPITPGEARLVAFAARAFGPLLWLYPGHFRRRHGADMRRLFADKLTDELRRKGPRGLPGLCLATLFDVIGNAAGERAAARRARRHPAPELYPFAPRKHRTAGDHLSAFPRDLRFACRSLRRTPGFTVVAALTLAVGIGANAAIFSFVNGIILRPLPYPDADRLVTVQHHVPGLGLAEANLSQATYVHYRNNSRVLESVGGYLENVVNLTGDGDPERVPVGLGTVSLFATLGVVPLHGRVLDDRDTALDSTRVVMIGHGLWMRRYGGDPTAVGAAIRLNGATFEIVGVLPPEFEFPRPGIDVWYPFAFDESEASFGSFDVPTVGKLAPGMTPADAVAELTTLLASMAGIYDGATRERLAAARPAPLIEPLKSSVVRGVATSLWLLSGSVGFLLLIACANVANLVGVRSEYRQHEVAVRRSLGAGHLDLMRFNFAESLVLGVLGAVGGLLAAFFAVRALPLLPLEGLPRVHEVRVDGSVALVALALSLAASAVFGALPAARQLGADLCSALKSSDRNALHGRAAVRGLLVATQIALALTLLVGSGLMVQSAWRLNRVDPGFDARDLLTVEIALPFRPYSDYARSAGFFHGLLDRVEGAAGVVAAGAASDMPLSPSVVTRLAAPLDVAGQAVVEGAEQVAVSTVMATPGYFETLRIPLLSGRIPGRDEPVGSTRPVLISVPLARRLFDTADPLGRRLRPRRSEGQLRYFASIGQEDPWYTVVGVVGGVRDSGMAAPASEILYLPVLSGRVDPSLTPSHMTLAIRTTGSPLALVDAVRSAVREIDPDMPIAKVATMQSIVAASTAQTRFTMLMMVIAAAVALLLGAVGLFGVIAYGVSRRTREIGVRMALGAEARDVVWMVGRQGATFAVAGLVVGAVAASILTRLFESLLFEVSATDPGTFAAAALLLFVVALLAAWLPARRAARIDPVIAMVGD